MEMHINKCYRAHCVFCFLSLFGFDFIPILFNQSSGVQEAIIN